MRKDGVHHGLIWRTLDAECCAMAAMELGLKTLVELSNRRQGVARICGQREVQKHHAHTDVGFWEGRVKIWIKALLICVYLARRGWEDAWRLQSLNVYAGRLLCGGCICWYCFVWCGSVLRNVLCLTFALHDAGTTDLAHVSRVVSFSLQPIQTV